MSDVPRAFEARFGRNPTVVARAPGRVNLIGEHVDYNGGRCLPIALSMATYAAMAPRGDGRVRAVSVQDPALFDAPLSDVVPGQVTGWAAYAAGVLWALRAEGLDVPGIDLLVDGRVPLGAGLSSSAALECSVALAVATLLGREDDVALRRQLVAACIRTEAEVAGAPTGGMDQTVSMLAQEGHALLVDFLDGSLRQVPWHASAAGLALVVVDTRASHSLVDGGYAARRADCEEAAAILGVALLAEATSLDGLDGRLRRRARHVLSEVERVDQTVSALDADDFGSVGRLFTASHESLRDDFEVSCEELDVTVEVALEHGALGARMTGGGFGGSAIALVPREARDAVVAAVADAFAGRDWPPPQIFDAAPGPPAEVVSVVG